MTHLLHALSVVLGSVRLAPLTALVLLGIAQTMAIYLKVRLGRCQREKQRQDDWLSGPPHS